MTGSEQQHRPAPDTAVPGQLPGGRRPSLAVPSFSAGCYVAGLDHNDTDSGKGGLRSSRDGSDNGGFEVTTSTEVAASATPSTSEPSSRAEEDYSEEDDTELATLGYIVDESVRGEQGPAGLRAVRGGL